MNLEHYTNRMAANAKVVESLLRGVSEAHWRPDDQSWSLLEVINHLYDEEREDFRLRLDYTLHRPGEEWPSIDPQGWVISREYRKRELSESLSNWLDERARSLEWLASLQKPDARATPWGQMRAGDLLAAWLAHDHLHIRQMNELHYAWHKAHAQPYSVEYAGE